MTKCTLFVGEESAIPVVLRGSWFSWENGRQTETELNAVEMYRNNDRGFYFVTKKEEYHVNYTIIFHHEVDNCYHCVKFMVRTVNVLEKIESKNLNTYQSYSSVYTSLQSTHDYLWVL